MAGVLGSTYELVEALGSTKTGGAGTNDEGLYFGGRHVCGWKLSGEGREGIGWMEVVRTKGGKVDEDQESYTTTTEAKMDTHTHAVLFRIESGNQRLQIGWAGKQAGKKRSKSEDRKSRK